MRSRAPADTPQGSDPPGIPSRWALEHLVGVVPCERVRIVASSHRLVMWVWLVQGVLVTPAAIRAARLDLIIMGDLMPMLIPLALATMLLTLRLRLALGDSPVRAIGWTALAGVPCLNVLTIPLISFRARSFLWPRVGHVPILGFSARTIEGWDSLCDGCGYDLSRTTGNTCPECGRESVGNPECP